MSEYWKSTPRYWCKFCSTYVKETKFEKAQHEATGKHQGSVQRSLRNLHKEHDKDEREKQRAKDEVARLNGLVSGSPVGGSAWKPGTSTSSSSGTKQVTATERKKQMQQLAEMGVAVPEQFRKEVAMAGEWQTVLRRVDEAEVKTDALSFGVRKRRLDEDEEEEAAQADLTNKKRWGTAIRTYPVKIEDTNDIGALLKIEVDSKADSLALDALLVKKEEDNEGEEKVEHTIQPGEVDKAVKSEDAKSGVATEQEEEKLVEAPIMFKKRKAKILR